MVKEAANQELQKSEVIQGVSNFINWLGIRCYDDEDIFDSEQFIPIEVEDISGELEVSEIIDKVIEATKKEIPLGMQSGKIFEAFISERRRYIVRLLYLSCIFNDFGIIKNNLGIIFDQRRKRYFDFPIYNLNRLFQAETFDAESVLQQLISEYYNGIEDMLIGKNERFLKYKLKQEPEQLKLFFLEDEEIKKLSERIKQNLSSISQILEKEKHVLSDDLGRTVRRSETQNCSDYISFTEPIFEDLEFFNFGSLTDKLKIALLENDGISEEEATTILSYIVQKSRLGLVQEFYGGSIERFKSDSLMGKCGRGQELTAELLESIGLIPNLNNNRDFSLIGYATKIPQHNFVTVEIPIKTDNGQIEHKLYLIDITYKQFCRTRKGVTRFIKDSEYGNKVGQTPGYLLTRLPGGSKLLDELLSNGFFELTEENAKLYFDAFLMEPRPLSNYGIPPEVSEIETSISGEHYIQILTGFTRKKLENSELETV